MRRDLVRDVQRMLTPPQVARRLVVDASKVIDWINSGQLKAANLAKSTAGRPRYKISEDWLAQFLEHRQASKPPPKPQRRRKTLTQVKQYF